jgi:hypothetical protein
MDGTGDHHVEQNMPNSKGWVSIVFTHMWKSKCKMIATAMMTIMMIKDMNVEEDWLVAVESVGRGRKGEDTGGE